MIYPIIAYGDSVLRKVAQSIDKNYPNLQQLIADMLETMHNAEGIGLAAPQIGLPIRLFVIDGSGLEEDDDSNLRTFKKTFINAQIIEEFGNEWAFEEGCLSIPSIREDVSRHESLKIRYLDENFNAQEETYAGMQARVIQHEYDHIEGVLFTDHLSSFKKRLIKNKLQNISKGDVKANYRMKFPLKK